MPVMQVADLNCAVPSDSNKAAIRKHARAMDGNPESGQRLHALPGDKVPELDFFRSQAADSDVCRRHHSERALRGRLHGERFLEFEDLQWRSEGRRKKAECEGAVEKLHGSSREYSLRPISCWTCLSLSRMVPDQQRIRVGTVSRKDRIIGCAKAVKDSLETFFIHAQKGCCVVHDDNARGSGGADSADAVVGEPLQGIARERRQTF